MISMRRFKIDCEDSSCHLALLLAPKMLMVLDPPTLRGSPRYEFPTRPHTIWCRSPIRYNGVVFTILKICLSSCLLARESGPLCLQTMRLTFLVSASVTRVKVLSPQRERVEVSLQSKGKSSNSVRDTQHSQTSVDFDGVVHTDAKVTNT